MQEKILMCKSCGRILNKEDNFVTALNLLSVEAYHEKCYSRELRTFKTMFLNNYPINGFSGNAGAIVGSVLAILSLFHSETRILSILLLIPLILRLISYFKYERYLR